MTSKEHSFPQYSTTADHAEEYIISLQKAKTNDVSSEEAYKNAYHVIKTLETTIIKKLQEDPLSKRYADETGTEVEIHERQLMTPTHILTFSSKQNLFEGSQLSVKKTTPRSFTNGKEQCEETTITLSKDTIYRSVDRIEAGEELEDQCTDEEYHLHSTSPIQIQALAAELEGLATPY